MSASTNVTALALRSAGGCGGKVAVRLEPSDAFKPPETKRASLEKVNNVWGSCAGSGSDFFPIYRRNRNAELARVNKMEQDWEDREVAEAFQAKREALMSADDEATASRRAKRQKRKENKAMGEKLRKEAEGINKFSGDGSFLDAMKKVDPKELEAALKEAKEATANAKKHSVTAKQMASEENIKIRDFDL
mmetsp:Transcript_100730/g.285485  ORF Transcript_100730/g.285485 Transcript_100730/m.285485 type:complete len:191 (-) Transcript_100730:41-613(-)